MSARERPFLGDALAQLRAEGWEGPDERLAGTFRCAHIELALALAEMWEAVRVAMPRWMRWVMPKGAK